MKVERERRNNKSRERVKKMQPLSDQVWGGGGVSPQKHGRDWKLQGSMSDWTG